MSKFVLHFLQVLPTMRNGKSAPGPYLLNIAEIVVVRPAYDSFGEKGQTSFEMKNGTVISVDLSLEVVQAGMKAFK